MVRPYLQGDPGLHARNARNVFTGKHPGGVWDAHTQTHDVHGHTNTQMNVVCVCVCECVCGMPDPKFLEIVAYFLSQAGTGERF